MVPAGAEAWRFQRQVITGGAGALPRGRGPGETWGGGVLSVVISAVGALACVSRLLVSGWWRALR